MSKNHSTVHTVTICTYSFIKLIFWIKDLHSVTLTTANPFTPSLVIFFHHSSPFFISSTWYRRTPYSSICFYQFHKTFPLIFKTATQQYHLPNKRLFLTLLSRVNNTWILWTVFPSAYVSRLICSLKNRVSFSPKMRCFFSATEFIYNAFSPVFFFYLHAYLLFFLFFKYNGQCKSQQQHRLKFLIVAERIRNLSRVSGQ